MEAEIRIQEEFEKLIAQLEKLRRVNEITSENSNSARVVIDEFEKIVAGVVEFRRIVQEDLEKRSKELGNVVQELKGSFERFDDNGSRVIGQLSSSFDAFGTKAEKLIASGNRYLLDILKVQSEELEMLRTDLSDLNKITTEIKSGLFESKRDFESLIRQVQKEQFELIAILTTKADKQEKAQKWNRIMLLVLMLLVAIGFIAMYLR